MNCYQLWIDIGIPILCAIIGGALTFGGVLLTIKDQHKKEKHDEKLKYTPYLKLSHGTSNDIINCRDNIKSTFDQEHIDFSTTKLFYAFVLKTFFVKNSSSSDCVLTEIILDNNTYELNKVLLLKDEIIGIATTNTFYVNIKEPLTKIYLKASDLLGNTYYYKCEFKQEYSRMKPIIVNYEKLGKSLQMYELEYTIINIGLPQPNIE